LLPVRQQIDYKLAVLTYKVRSTSTPSYLSRNNNNNNNKRQFGRRRNMSVDITRAPYRQSWNVVRDISTETRL